MAPKVWDDADDVLSAFDESVAHMQVIASADTRNIGPRR